jgi:uncharacterized protein with LGFP repeats
MVNSKQVGLLSKDEAQQVNEKYPYMAYLVDQPIPSGTLKASAQDLEMEIKAAINEAYSQYGGEHGFLGKAMTELEQCPDGLGFFVYYQGGLIFWTSEDGAQVFRNSRYAT